MNYSNNTYDVITDKRSIPYSSNGLGTISTSGITVVGVGTKFLSQMPMGSVLVDLNSWEWRKVLSVTSDTEATLTKPFTIDLAVLTVPNIIHETKLNNVEISLKVKDTDPDALLDNKVFNGILTLSKASRETSSTRDFVDPIIVDASGTFMNVLIMY
jgi:hypothetical protein